MLGRLRSRFPARHWKARHAPWPTKRRVQGSEDRDASEQHDVTSHRDGSMAAKQRIVQKYGGTSVGTPERIRAVAERVKRVGASGCELAVVVSAMAGETNRLLALAGEMAPDPFDREVDVLVSTGEQVTTALLAIGLQAIGVPAVSMQGHQVRIATDSSYGRARIKSIDVSRVE